MAARHSASARRRDAAHDERADRRCCLHAHQFRRSLSVFGWACGVAAIDTRQCYRYFDICLGANSAVCVHGRDAVSQRSGAEGDRRDRSIDPARPKSYAGCCDRCRDGVLRNLRVNGRHHRDARFADAARDAEARLQLAFGDGVDHGHRCGRCPHSAIRTGGASWQPGRDTHHRSADWRDSARARPRSWIYRLHNNVWHHLARSRGRQLREPAGSVPLALDAFYRRSAAPYPDFRARRCFDDCGLGYSDGGGCTRRRGDDDRCCAFRRFDMARAGRTR